MTLLLALAALTQSGSAAPPPPNHAPPPVAAPPITDIGAAIRDNSKRSMDRAADALDEAVKAQLMSIKLYPEQPLIERTRMGQAINFDLELTNKSDRELELTAIRAVVRDPSGAVVQRLEINDNGIAPGIATIPTRLWKPGEAHTIFNPFHTLASDIPIGAISFEFILRAPGPTQHAVRIRVAPLAYVQKTRLTLPMPGRLLVWDGHDYHSHHRRWSFSHPVVRTLGLLTNPGRYSFDLVVADHEGRFFAGEGDKVELYFGYGHSVIAPGDGRVVDALGTAPNEPSEPDQAAFRKNPMEALFGNYIVIDHGNGEYSQLGHLKQGSLLIKKGEEVRAGQPIAQVGQSGTSLFPHLHYQLVTRPGVDAEGLPVRFDQGIRILGGHSERKSRTSGSTAATSSRPRNQCRPRTAQSALARS